MISQTLIAIFVASVLIQLAYSVIYYFQIGKFKNLARNVIGQPVSVVVCTHNRVDWLRVLIGDLLKQEYPQYEIIIVNDRSVDETSSYLKELAGQDLITSVDVDQTPPGYNSKKYALTQGIEMARNDIILLTDDDCRPLSKRWIQQMAQQFDETGQIVIGYSQYETHHGWLNRFIRYETLLTGMNYISLALAGYPYMGVGRNMAFRKSFFQRKGGYEGYEMVTGGDDDLFVNQNSTRANTRVCIGPDSLVMSVPKSGMSGFFSQKKRRMAVGSRYKLSDKIRIGTQVLTHLLFWASFLILATTGKPPLIILVGFLLRIIVNGWVYSRVARKLGDHFNIWYSPVLDFLYSVYYVIVGFSALFSKAIRWN